MKSNFGGITVVIVPNLSFGKCLNPAETDSRRSFY